MAQREGSCDPYVDGVTTALTPDPIPVDDPVARGGLGVSQGAALKGVDEVFLEESLDLKRDYIVRYGADVLVMGDDWAGRFDEFRDVCEVVYLERTPAISTTAIIEHIADL